TRWLEATDPLGGIERVDYRHQAPGIGSSESAVPQGMIVGNAWLQFRNSFYWDKRALLIPGLGTYIRHNYSGGDLIDACSRADRIGWWAATALPIVATAAEAISLRVAKGAATAVAVEENQIIRSVGAAKNPYLPLPARARVYTDAEEAFSHLERYHGIDPELASERLHAIKDAVGKRGADNVLFGRTGGVTILSHEST